MALVDQLVKGIRRTHTPLTRFLSRFYPYETGACKKDALPLSSGGGRPFPSIAPFELYRKEAPRSGRLRSRYFFLRAKILSVGSERTDEEKVVYGQETDGGASSSSSSITHRRKASSLTN